jgi:xanthine dehydrogenase small subunit
MRSNIVLYINGREHRPHGADVFMPLTDYLRYHQSMLGTKVVCAEGDCGACTVLIGRIKDPAAQELATKDLTTKDLATKDASSSVGKLTYVPVNGCIQYIYQLDGCHVITVEGLTAGSKCHKELNPVQESMVKNNGAQCGYCTPGFIVAMSAVAYCPELVYRDTSASAQPGCHSAEQIKDALTGNLCRCTGYEAIVKAGLESQFSEFTPLTSLFEEAKIAQHLALLNADEVFIESDGREFYLPATVETCSQYLAQHPDSTLVSGGTDVSVNCNKRGFCPPSVVSTARLPGLASIDTLVEDGRKVLRVGGRVTLSQLERTMYEQMPQLNHLLWTFGSPQIRLAGTLAGNIANGSPIADTIPYLICLDGAVEASSTRGKRRIAMRDFYLGYKTLALAKDEVITAIYLPLPHDDEIVRLYKITRREHLDISSFTAAISLKLSATQTIERASVVFGGVAATVMHIDAVENFLVGKEHSLATFVEAGKLAKESIKPITDVRGSKDYRLQLAQNIMRKFYFETIN